jgi:hypothetical protein
MLHSRNQMFFYHEVTKCTKAQEEEFITKVFEAKQRPIEPQMDTDKH